MCNICVYSFYTLQNDVRHKCFHEVLPARTEATRRRYFQLLQYSIHDAVFLLNNVYNSRCNTISTSTLATSIIYYAVRKMKLKPSIKLKNRCRVFYWIIHRAACCSVLYLSTLNKLFRCIFCESMSGHCKRYYIMCKIII